MSKRNYGFGRQQYLHIWKTPLQHPCWWDTILTGLGSVPQILSCRPRNQSQPVSGLIFFSLFKNKNMSKMESFCVACLYCFSVNRFLFLKMVASTSVAAEEKHSFSKQIVTNIITGTVYWINVVCWQILFLIFYS